MPSMRPRQRPWKKMLVIEQLLNNKLMDTPGYDTRKTQITRQETAVNWVFGLLAAAIGIMFVMIRVHW